MSGQMGCLDGMACRFLEHAQAPHLVRIGDIDQVVRDKRSLELTRFGCTDIHAAVEQP